MHVVRHPSADAFLAAAEPWLMRAEVENNVILGVARSLAEGALVLDDPPYLATVMHDEEVVACALRTPPYKPVVSHADPEAARAIARDVFALDPEIPAVSGPELSAGVFAGAWADLAGATVQVGRRQRLYVIHSLGDFAPPAAGQLRRAEESELDVAVRWTSEFSREATPSEPSDPDAIVRRFSGQGALFFWDDGEPVSICAFGGKTPNGVRISLVYTPPPFRRRGYATAAVTALTRRLLGEGRRHCCLYTDLANPTSNAIYQTIGYRPVCDVNDYVFAAGTCMTELQREDPGPAGDVSAHRVFEELEAALRALPDAPKDTGTLVRIVRRRADGVRETPERVHLVPGDGVPGDGWGRRPPRDPEAELAVMREDVADLLANGQPLTLFGDNLFVRLDISTAHLPPGTRLRVGDAVVEVTWKPHNGCIKFKGRFGDGALRLVQQSATRDQNLRGIYWKVVEAGDAGVGSPIRVLSRPSGGGA